MCVVGAISTKEAADYFPSEASTADGKTFLPRTMPGARAFSQPDPQLIWGPLPATTWILVKRLLLDSQPTLKKNTQERKSHVEA